MKQLTAKITRPVATSSRASIRFISKGSSGMTSSCGSPVQASTSPTCSEL